ncbi:polysaccharide deacetylase family protein, partial [Sphaerochaeta sp. S2]|uniref:polysaccharide deacetylase family protein n=1 Tax=Sphaerochaeta sp. S2 TaxID=2798868 RepID=UPI0018E945E5
EIAMIQLGFAFNFNVQRCEIEVGDEAQIINKGYRPLIDLFEKYHLKANCFLSGFTTKLLENEAPDLLATIKELHGKTLELGTYTYTHPIPQLLKKEEFSRQMRKGLDIDREVLGVETDGFLPPEFAYSGEMGEVLADEGVKWFVALASQIEKGLKSAGITRDPYVPFKVRLADDRSLVAVPAVYQLPQTPARFFKLMMKGQVPVDTVIEGVREFAEAHPGGLLLFKRDAETIFIDMFNSGFEGTFEVMDEFLSKLSQLDCIQPSFISETMSSCDESLEIMLPDYLGNTKIETFTEGAAQSIWDATVEVRDALIACDRKHKSNETIEEAWEHLMLSHNSDGRIGYWFSEWNPGEHVVAPSRRTFVEEHLAHAKALLD